MSKFFKIIKKYKMEPYLKRVVNRSTSLLGPYHNFYHHQHMVVNAHDIAKGLVNKEEMRALLVAALFHDYSHSLGELEDSWNIKKAVNGVSDVMTELHETAGFIIDVINNIEATQYPYIIDARNLTFSQKVMRDADLSQICTDNYIQQNVLGLLHEINIRTVNSGGSLIPLTRFITVQRNFLNSIVWNTEVAANKYPKIVRKKLEELDALGKILS